MSGQSILNNLDFTNIIGGPLDATIKAQTDSAFATMEYINTIGFAPPGAASESGKAMGAVSTAEEALEKAKEEWVTAKNADPLVANTVTGKKNAMTTAEEKLKTALEIADEKSGELGDVRYISFFYEIAGEGKQNGHIKVPLLTIVPVPYISIHSLDIDFSVKINESITRERETETKRAGREIRVGRSGWNLGFAHRSNTVVMRGTYSNKSVSRYKQTHTAEYNMGIKVHAQNIDMPAGLSRILGILEANLIASEKPAE